MKVLFAPDWRAGVPYQHLLAEALQGFGIQVAFAGKYQRRLPLLRGTRGNAELLHLHWPEAYFPKYDDRWDAVRKLRYSLDLRLATRHLPLIFTAHNLYPHHRAHDPLARWNMRCTARQAAAVIVHSQGAKRALSRTFALAPERISVIPHGDLAAALEPPQPRAAARAALRLGSEKLCLIFGMIQPYKGLEEAIDAWKSSSLAARLIILGKPQHEEYAAALQLRAQDDPRITVQPGWLDDTQLHLWLSAVDATLFNYRSIFTSGAASLARSFGLPIILPSRLETLDLQEPSPRVCRFSEGELSAAAAAALEIGPDYASAAAWRHSIRWEAIAAETAALYRRTISASQITRSALT